MDIQPFSNSESANNTRAQPAPAAPSAIDARSTPLDLGRSHDLESVNDTSQERFDSDAIIEDSDNESELSELEATPPPPTAELRSLEMKYNPPEIECTHKTWCTCNMHSSYGTDKAYPHLSEWALSSVKSAESHEREKVSPSASEPKGHGDVKARGDAGPEVKAEK